MRASVRERLRWAVVRLLVSRLLAYPRRMQTKCAMRSYAPRRTVSRRQHVAKRGGRGGALIMRFAGCYGTITFA